MPLSRRWHLSLAVAMLAGLVTGAAWSYATGGLISQLFTPADGTTRVETLRLYVSQWGPLAPLAYVAIVVVEVLVAPFPGALLYAPGGALFGGWLGGTLSLIGNTLGAAIAAWIAGGVGEGWLRRRMDHARFATLRDRLARRGGWLVFLLRLNPLTSSDFVSYAAGLAGVRPLPVALGTMAGMAPQCYLQAHFAATLVEVLPDTFAGLLGLVLLIAAAAAAFLLVRRTPSPPAR